MPKTEYNEAKARANGKDLQYALVNDIAPIIQRLADMGCRVEFNVDTIDGVTRLTRFVVQAPLDLDPPDVAKAV